MSTRLIDSPSPFGRVLAPIARVIFKLALGANGLTTAQIRQRLDLVGAMTRNLKGVRRIPQRIGDLEAQWLIPDAANDDSPVILYLHGGAYVSGSIRSHWELAGRLARAAQARCLIIDYRLAPEHPYPAALDDAVAAWEWLLNEGYPSERMLIAGDSAGGGLALATILRLREIRQPQAAGLYCMSPFTDLSLTAPSHHSARKKEVVLTNPDMLAAAVADYTQGQNPRAPLISPAYADFSGLPPMLIHVGSDEVLLDDSTRLHDRAIACGTSCTLTIWQGMWHVWPIFDRFGLAEARDALHQAGQFIQAACSENTSHTAGGTRHAA